jgi:neutral ceramidase
MKIRACLWLVFAGLLAVVAANAQSPASGNLRAGAAKLDITPGENDLRNPTDVIRDHLFARAIVVHDGKTCAVLIGFDLSKVDDQASNRHVPPPASTAQPWRVDRMPG